MSTVTVIPDTKPDLFYDQYKVLVVPRKAKLKQIKELFLLRPPHAPPHWRAGGAQLR